MTIARGYINNFSTTLNGSITNVATSILVHSAAGISAALSLADYVLLTIDDGTNVEIVQVTGVSTNTLTVVRGQEGTSGTAFADGKTVELRLTKGSFDNGFDVVKQVTLAGGETTVKFEGLTPGTYEIDLSYVGVNNGGSPPALTLQVGTGGTPTYQTSSYRYSLLHFADNSSTLSIDNPGSTSYILLWDALEDGNALFSTCGTIKMSDLGVAKYKEFDIDLRSSRTGGGVGVAVRKGCGAWNDSTTVTALQIAPSAGVYRAGGIFTLLKRRF